MLAIYGAGLPAFVLHKVLQPLFYAREDSRSPFRFAIVSMLVNAVIAVGLMPYIGFAAAALATTLAGWMMAAQLWFGTRRMGDAARTKLVNNLLTGINLVGAAEALALARRLGLDPGFTLDVIEQSSGQSWIGSDRMRRAIAGDLAPRAHVTLLEKDTRLAVQAARAAGFAGPLGERAAGVFEQAHAAGMADLDDAALLQLLRGARS